MNKQIDKLQMLITLEKGMLCEQLQHQKKQALLVSIFVALLILVLLAINVAIFCHISDFTEYAKNAWLVAGLNTMLAGLPLSLLMTNRKRTPPENAANDIREALLADFKENVETSAMDIKYSIEKVQTLSRDIRTFSEGGLTALIPLIKLASGALDTNDNVKKRIKSSNKEST